MSINFKSLLSVGYGSLRSASFAKIATLNAIEIAQCKDENPNSFCIKNHEKRLRDLDLGSSGRFSNVHQIRFSGSTRFIAKSVRRFWNPKTVFCSVCKSCSFYFAGIITEHIDDDTFARITRFDAIESGNFLELPTRLLERIWMLTIT